MILSGRIIKGHKTLYQKSIADTCAPQSDFRDRLENCLLGLCKDADISAPVWMTVNTNELARFRKTSFYAAQFNEAVNFDRFEIRIVEA